MDLQIENHRELVDRTYYEISDTCRQAYSFRSLADNSQSIDRISRYRNQARRAFTTALKTLQLLQGSRFNKAPIDPEDPSSLAPSVSPTTQPADPKPELSNPDKQSPAAPKLFLIQQVSAKHTPPLKSGRNEPEPLAAAA